MRYRLRVSASAVLLFFSFNQFALAAQTYAPDAIVAQFYIMYLSRLNIKSDPLKDVRYLHTYLSNALIAELTRPNTHGIDYFTKSQERDSYTDWMDGLSVTDSVNNATAATEVLTMGKSKDSARTLTVTLVKEDNGWKIRKVENLEDSRFYPLR